MSQDQDEEWRRTISGIFGRAAETYDRVGPSFFSHFGRGLVAAAALPRGARVLDIATGRGACLFPAAEAVGPEGQVIGTDLAEPMVAAVTADARGRGLSNVETRVMGAEALDFPDASFDAVLCGFAVFFLPDPWRALSEWRRVLRPGGRLAMSTWGAHDKRWEWLGDLFERYLREESEESEEETERPRPVFREPEGLEAFLREGGFTAIRVECEAAEFVYANEEEWWRAQYSHGGRHELEAVEKRHGPDGLARFKTEAFAGLATVRREDGIPLTWTALYSVAEKA